MLEIDEEVGAVVVSLCLCTEREGEKETRGGM